MDIRQKILSILPLRMRFALRYMAIHGRFSLLINPKRFNEKLALRLASDRRELLRICADKVRMREWLIDHGYAGFLPEILHVVSAAGDVDWSCLPDRFVMKGSHGSGFVRIVNDFNADHDDLVPDLKENIGQWLAVDYGMKSREWAYVNAEKRIIFEKFIESDMADSDGTPWDLKFFCFSGRCEMIQVDSGRFGEHVRDLFSREWDRLDCHYVHPRSFKPPSMPPGFGQALELAEDVSKHFDFVRVDLYLTGDKPLIGELTMTPEGGVGRFSNPEVDVKLGHAWKQVLQ